MGDEPESQDALASFMSITGANSGTALQFLELTNWNLDEAVNLFMESGRQNSSSAFIAPHQTAAQPSPASHHPVPTSSMDIDAATAAAIAAAYGEDDNAVRAPDPSKRQRLVDSDMGLMQPMRHLRDQNRDFAAESIAAITASSISTAFGSLGAVESTNNLSNADGHVNEHTGLNTLYQPPTNIMFLGSYAEARTNAKFQGKWLLVNIQDEIVFASHMLNRDTWSDDVVQNFVASGFVFWQNYWTWEHGKKFCSLYQIDRDSLPIVMIIDPRTGEIQQRWSGFYEPQDMTEKLSDFCCMHTIDKSMIEQKKEAKPDLLDVSEDDQLAAAIAASIQDNDNGEVKQAGDPMEFEEKAQQSLVALTPEPDACAPDVTRIQIRVPDGSRLTRRFFKTDSLAMVWTFVKDQIPEARLRAFELRTAFPPGAVAYNDMLSIEEGKLENASLMVKWL
ncbi:Predicted ubiquitin regulatory protein, contains UAS and UBX domains [Plasmopara halstedii]|uniref:Predicted ubiquitin regulatory protein, contains UAS and UBX domains n=1 Tax=Plasmopara halstedii TaxID=4781 RepID=A0A0P1B6F8_PLAHL|nr:Predicted ubiquitin regulatory protein, contains UAS and UBX domains [Plasmopara halstedii]CEG49313.1 Predicted ubiquitin regulatory protein, contains UAS and UBX domains [Plasmopara halstedii]|eukprot:XP_024585682.1 Predicted ubiquitin regulatory protein, contains UAS and UBX domains [Plasmopara halstedii]